MPLQMGSFGVTGSVRISAKIRMYATNDNFFREMVEMYIESKLSNKLIVFSVFFGNNTYLLIVKHVSVNSSDISAFGTIRECKCDVNLYE